MAKSIEILGEVSEGLTGRLSYNPALGTFIFQPHNSNAWSALVAQGDDVSVGDLSAETFTFANGLQIVSLSVAIVANTTVTTSPAGSIGITSHATGVGTLFMSDGEKWQYALVAAPE